MSEPKTCDVSGCDQSAVALLANNAPLLSPEYREWYACRWHRRVGWWTEDLDLDEVTEATR